MAEILMKAAAFVAIILMGYLLRKKGFFKEEDFHVLSKIVLKITLPAAIVANFSGAQVEASLLILSLLGLGGGVIMMGGGWLAAGKNREEKSFFILNSSGYNIGNFTMPFAQSFLGPAGVITTSFFDTGNSFICLGGAYSVAQMVKNGEGKISLIPILKTLIRSVPFDAYVLMTVLSLLHLTLPAPVITFSGVISGANAFMAMLMMGVGFKISGDTSQKGKNRKDPCTPQQHFYCHCCSPLLFHAASSGIPAGPGNPSLKPHRLCCSCLHCGYEKRFRAGQRGEFDLHRDQYRPDHRCFAGSFIGEVK